SGCCAPCPVWMSHADSNCSPLKDSHLTSCTCPPVVLLWPVVPTLSSAVSTMSHHSEPLPRDICPPAGWQRRCHMRGEHEQRRRRDPGGAPPRQTLSWAGGWFLGEVCRGGAGGGWRELCHAPRTNTRLGWGVRLW